MAIKTLRLVILLNLLVVAWQNQHQSTYIQRYNTTQDSTEYNSISPQKLVELVELTIDPPPLVLMLMLFDELKLEPVRPDWLWPS
jgi:hypothetical protein